MPSVLPTIPNDPPQGIQALLDKVYLWNPDVSNDLIEKINALLTKLGDAIGAIRPYNEMVAPINQYEPCYYGDGVYVAKNYLAERAEEFNEEDWILIARKEITADKIHINFAGQDETLQNAIDTLKTDQGELGDQVSSIESKIPADASETNQLVTKNEVLALPTFTYTVVNELPETGEEKIIYLVPKDGSAPDVHDEYIWIESTQTFELIGTTQVDLTDYVKKTDYATFNNAGILRPATELGTSVNVSGYLQAYTRVLEQYNSASNMLFIGKGTLENIKDDYVKRGITANTITLTDEEKTAAQAWLGIDSAGGGASLPDQTGNAGKFLMTDGESVSWGSAIKNGGDSITGTYNFGGDSGMKMNVIEGFAGGIQFFTAQYNQKGPEITASTIGLGVNGVLYNVEGIFAKSVARSGKLEIPTEAGTLARLEDLADINNNSVATKDLTVGTDEGTINIGITAGVATIATNNGLDIVSQTKFDTAPTTDDATAWADVNATALVTKAQVTTALSTAGGGASITIRNWA